MAAARTRPACGRYSPPVSPRTISTEPSPDLASEGGDYFLDQLDNNQADTSNKECMTPCQDRITEIKGQNSKSPSSNDRPRPPALHLRTNQKQESKCSTLSDPRSQAMSPGANKPLSAVCLDIRPLQELLNERSYLLYNLQKQEERATSLFRRYATLEARLAEAQTPKEARRIRKDAKLIKHKITENTQQEQLIFLRLGEIYIETQNRERWMQFHQPQSATFPTHAYFPPLFYGTGEVTAAPPPPPPQPPLQSICLTPYPFSPYLTAQQSPAVSYSNSASALSPFSPDFVPGVTFSEDIWARAGASPQSSVSPQHTNARHGQNYYPVEPDTKPSTELMGGNLPQVSVVDEEYDENKWHQEEDDDPQEVFPWHKLKHNVEGTSTPPSHNNANGLPVNCSVKFQVDPREKEDGESGDTTATPTTAEDGDSENDEESRIFKNYLRAVSLHEDAGSPSPLTPHNCYNWVGPRECGGGGAVGGEAGKNISSTKRRFKSMPILPLMKGDSAGNDGKSESE